MEGMGGEKLYFHLLKSIKRPKGPLGQSVSANFVADCGLGGGGGGGGGFPPPPPPPRTQPCRSKRKKLNSQVKEMD